MTNKVDRDSSKNLTSLTVLLGLNIKRECYRTEEFTMEFILAK